MAKAWHQWIPQPLRARLTSRASLRKILVNTIWLFMDRALTTLISVVIGAWVARHLGPAEWGKLGYAASFTGLFLVFATLGLDEIVIRAIVRKDAPQENILGTAFILRLIAAITTYIIVAVLIWQIESDLQIRALVLIAAGNLILQPFNVIELWFQSRVESKYVVWVKNATLLLISGLKIILIFGQMPVIAFGWTALLWQIMIAIGLLLMFSRYGPRMIAWRIQWSLGWALLKDAWPLIIAGLAASIYMKIDQVMLGSMLGSSAVGIYAVAVRLSELWRFLPIALAASLFPAIVRTRESQEQTVYKKRLQAFYDVMVGLAFAIALLMTLLAPFLVSTLFGPQYADSTAILQTHIWALVFVSLVVARNKGLLVENRTRFVMVATSLGAAANVILNYWLIPRYSGMGAAWATIISYVVSGYLSCLLSRELWPLFKQLTLSLLLPFRLRSVLSAIKEVI